jgi:hypothetical protein
MLIQTFMKTFMKSLAFILLLGISATAAQPQGGYLSPTNQWVRSGAVSNVVVEFRPNTPEGWFQATQPVGYHFRGLSGRQPIIFLSEPYACRIRCFDDAGRLVPLTKEGQRFGARFENANNDPKIFRRVGPRYKMLDRAGVTPESIAGDRLPAPDTLFRLEAGQSYTLRVEVQCIWSGSRDRKLIRFMPVELKVVK